MPMLRQVECELPNGPIRKNGIFSLTSSVIRKFS